MIRLIQPSLPILLLAAALTAQSLPGPEDVHPEMHILLERMRDRVTQYYTELQMVAWTDNVRKERLKKDGTPKEQPEEFVFDSIVKLQQPSARNPTVPFYVREVNEVRIRKGKPVKKGEAIRPTDPAYLGIDVPSALVLSDSPDIRLSDAGEVNFEGRRTFILDVTSPQKTPPRVEFRKTFVGFGIRSHFEIFNMQYTKGRIWVDANTYDVIRVERRSDPFNFEFKGKKYTSELAMTLRFRSIAFEDSEQRVLVPESSEFIHTIMGTDAPIRRTFHSFSDYKRFAADVEIAPLEASTEK